MTGRRKKRGRPFTVELRAEEGVGVLFFSPSKVQKARELQDAKEAAKEREALEEISKAKARAASKAQKKLEAQRKREYRAARAEARKAEDALKKARREQAREAKKAQKQFRIEYMAQRTRPRGRPPKKTLSSKAASTIIEPIEEMIPVPPKSRRGRVIKRTARFDEK